MKLMYADDVERLKEVDTDALRFVIASSFVSEETRGKANEIIAIIEQLKEKFIPAIPALLK